MDTTRPKSSFYLDLLVPIKTDDTHRSVSPRTRIRARIDMIDRGRVGLHFRRDARTNGPTGNYNCHLIDGELRLLATAARSCLFIVS